MLQAGQLKQKRLLNMSTMRWGILWLRVTHAALLSSSLAGVRLAGVPLVGRVNATTRPCVLLGALSVAI